MEAVRDRSAQSDLQKNARLAQKLARELRLASNAKVAYDISRELARVSREIAEAARASEEADRDLRDVV